MMGFCGTDGEGIVWEAGVGVDDAAVFHKAGFLLGYELVLCVELFA